MTLTKQEVRGIVDLYIQAWVGQDPDLIITILTDTATYHERVLEEPIKDREGIRAYWQTKVVESQDNIKCELLNLYLDGNTAIVEWEAQFDDVVQMVRKRMREVAILVFEGQLIASLREYWASERIDQRPPRPVLDTRRNHGIVDETDLT
ncbi:MAG: nuclear transport factor 2 family protein [Pseudonocardiaceae bacterium]